MGDSSDRNFVLKQVIRNLIFYVTQKMDVYAGKRYIVTHEVHVGRRYVIQHCAASCTHIVGRSFLDHDAGKLNRS